MFRLDLLVKDIALAQELLSSHGLESSMGVTAAALYEKALEQGLGALDYSAVYRAVESDGDAVESDA
jgi:3-hydroxyisobutyrate dehydrogenase-like beta-hydroxyacid dehydrogenase